MPGCPAGPLGSQGNPGRAKRTYEGLGVPSTNKIQEVPRRTIRTKQASSKGGVKGELATSGFPVGARRNQEEPGVTTRNQQKPGGTIESQKKLEGPRTQGSARRWQSLINFNSTLKGD